MFRTYQEINLDWLRANYQRIYFFGLGFIQVKLNEEFRIHFYHPNLPAFVESPHNHRYDFTSTILKGEFTNVVYEEIPGNSHLINFESCQENSPILLPGKVTGLKEVSKKTYHEGQSYFMGHETFHKVLGSNCITLLHRTNYKKDLAEVATKVGEEKICPFKNKIPEDNLWSLIQKMLES